eukprot:9721-Eustigmatos_ZCMA.PRE.1
MNEVGGVRDVNQLASRIADLQGRYDLAEAALAREQNEARKAAEAAASVTRSLEEQKAQLQKDFDEAKTDLGVLH